MIDSQDVAGFFEKAAGLAKGALTEDEYALAMADPECSAIWWGKPKVAGGDPLTYAAMADRAEELGLPKIAATWRGCSAAAHARGKR